MITHFNSQPHKEADWQLAITIWMIKGISTHSLTRRLTGQQQVLGDTVNISTHSLTRRLTGFEFRISCVFFISTHSLTRRLTCRKSKGDGAVDISTHSLTRRLTMHRIVLNMHQAHFNSQPHKEADLSVRLHHNQGFVFQLTASQGG